MSKPIPANHIRINKKIKAEIKAQEERTGISRAQILYGHGVKRPEGLTTHVMKNILRRKSIPKEWWEFIHSAWTLKPTIEKAEVAYNSAGNRLRPGYIEVTAEMSKKVKHEIKRTGLKARELLRGRYKADMPIGMTYTVLDNIEKHASIKKAHYEYGISLWEALPDGEARTIPYTDDMKAHINQEKERTRYTYKALINSNLKALPEDINLSKLTSQLNSVRVNIETKVWLYARDSYARLPDYVENEPIKAEIKMQEEPRKVKPIHREHRRRFEIQEDDRDYLTYLRHESGMSQTEFLKNLSYVSRRVSAPLIGSWINGYVESAECAAWNWTIQKWAAAAGIELDERFIK